MYSNFYNRKNSTKLIPPLLPETRKNLYILNNIHADKTTFGYDVVPGGNVEQHAYHLWDMDDSINSSKVCTALALS